MEFRSICLNTFSKYIAVIHSCKPESDDQESVKEEEIVKSAKVSQEESITEPSHEEYRQEQTGTLPAWVASLTFIIPFDVDMLVSLMVSFCVHDQIGTIAEY